MANETKNKLNKAKLAVAILVSFYFLYYIFSADQFHFIDNVNLIIHEAGHVIFFPFGDTLHVAGGSLMQILIPAAFVVYFYLDYQIYSASLVLFWLGQNIVNVSVYAGDAIRMQLPLLGGDESIHDWNYLLVNSDLLHYTNQIAIALRFIGIVVILTAIFLSIKNSFEYNKYPRPSEVLKEWQERQKAQQQKTNQPNQ